MGNDPSKVEEIIDLIKNDDFCSFASLIAENESIIKESDDYGRTLLWVSFFSNFRTKSREKIFGKNLKIFKGACHHGKSGMVSLLLNHKPKINQSGGEKSTTPLMEASNNGHVDVVSIFRSSFP